MMADKQGLLGARSMEPPDDDGSGSHSSGGPVRDDREAYEEDWYRSLRSLAERQQLLADQEEEKEEGEEGAGEEEEQGPPEPEVPEVPAPPEVSEVSEPQEPAPDALFAQLREAERLEGLGRGRAEDPTAQAIANLLEAATHPAPDPGTHSRREGFKPHLHVVAEAEEELEADPIPRRGGAGGARTARGVDPD